MKEDKSSIITDNGVLLCYEDKLAEFETSAFRDTAIKLLRLCTQPKGTAFNQLNQFRKLVPVLIRGYCAQSEMSQALSEQLERVTATSEQNKYKRWTPEEENWLIDLVVSDTSILEISTIMGRSASAIKSKVSSLVGLQRISQKVAGKFLGTINGESVEGMIEGTVLKK